MGSIGFGPMNACIIHQITIPELPASLGRKTQNPEGNSIGMLCALKMYLNSFHCPSVVSLSKMLRPEPLTGELH